MHIVLIGASIGKAWNLAGWSARVRLPEISAESIAVWQFDKGDALDEVLLRPSRKVHFTRTFVRSLFQPPPVPPDIIILKECSSYFPGSLTAYEEMTAMFIRRVQARGIRIVVATVVPVTRARAAEVPGKQESLLQFNEWLRGYAHDHELPVLDLASALRTAENNAYLRDEYTSGDGTHLNAAAYAVLDKELRNLLAKGVNVSWQLPVQ